jgi:hypothetical protein
MFPGGVTGPWGVGVFVGVKRSIVDDDQTEWVTWLIAVWEYQPQAGQCFVEMKWWLGGV